MEVLYIMRMNFGTGSGSFGKTIHDIGGFKTYSRFIVFNKINSSTIPDVLDIIFNLNPRGTGSFVSSEEKKTKVVVINISEVYGDAHGRRDVRTRNAYIHYGYCDCDMNEINGETPIIFTNFDYNIIPDKPSEVEKNALSAMGKIYTSYDSKAHGDEIFRDTKTYNKILTPTPNFYEEKDMLLIGNQESDYMTELKDNSESTYFTSFDRYFDNLYKIRLMDLIDDHTKIAKLNISIERISINNIVCYNSDDDLDDFVTDIVSNLKYELEMLGFCGGEFRFDGEQGYNIIDLRTYLDLSIMEKRLNLRCLHGKLNDMCEENFNPDDKFSLIIWISYSQVKVKIIEKVPISSEAVTNTDMTTNELSDKIKDEVVGCMF
jgi:hypothetical protein